ncbi:hypothetical protein D9V96_000735 [Zobellia laminariae]|uniref:hypothetical protein n=1 Tax=Zobellia laminariae TaxID=248906 RepID=UPI0012D96961|nr:hypothetical protein [Zobellia laminariae]
MRDWFFIGLWLFCSIYMVLLITYYQVENWSLIGEIENLIERRNVKYSLCPSLRERSQMKKNKAMQGQYYLRLDLNIENEIITIAHAKKVVGPVLQLAEIHLAAGILYEVRKNGGRLDLGAIPYDALLTNFDNIIKDGAQASCLAEIGPYNIHVRIPLERFDLNDFEKIEITIYDLKKVFANISVSEDSLALQFTGKIEKVAVLKCIDVASLSIALKRELHEIFQE